MGVAGGHSSLDNLHVLDMRDGRHFLDLRKSRKACGQIHQRDPLAPVKVLLGVRCHHESLHDQLSRVQKIWMIFTDKFWLKFPILHDPQMN